MENEASYYEAEGKDDATERQYHIWVALLSASDANDLFGFTVKYKFTPPIPPPSNCHYCHPEGDLSLRDGFATFLDGCGFPAAARDDTLRILFDHVIPDYQARVEMEHVMEQSMRDSPKPTPARKEAVEALERVMIKGDERETKCAVCLGEFSVGCEATMMPCSHVFHGDCIVKWLENGCDCPLCRFKLPASVEEEVEEETLEGL